jgi:hypothetical protein
MALRNILTPNYRKGWFLFENNWFYKLKKGESTFSPY